MIQSILFFVLGFLCAGFIAVLITPVAWRRAVNLTRKRIEGSMPLTPSEIQAEKDRIRAEAAMSIRRLEMKAESLQAKNASQLVDVGRAQEQVKKLAAERDAKLKAHDALAVRVGALTADLTKRDEELKRLGERLAEIEGSSTMSAEELEKLGRMYDEASFSSSSRQIELVARESELERLTSELSKLKAQRKEADLQGKAMALETRTAREALTAEKKRASDLARKVETLTATLADRDDRLERRERELARLRDASKGNVSVGASSQASALASVEADADIDRRLAKLSADRERLEERLTTLARENKRLKTENSVPALPNGPGEVDENARLREQMNELAAHVVNLAAKLDGPDSPIAKALAAETGEGAGRKISLADRVRALQTATSAD
ncbi:hypothetical protein [Mesorhizobium sp. DCY119]|uniref:hypothetical protein n=1 Tax=Mesorhizobium sp. DCY119 TaxID=2108445 RepID=UPI000E6B5896|nr:hypothetical protein [Mesorhizobium sp. DCY119]RJG44143.1 hypothetical protein D3Y55_07690 [Mesorhizobium sp. DCY119]